MLSKHLKKHSDLPKFLIKLSHAPVQPTEATLPDLPHNFVSRLPSFPYQSQLANTHDLSKGYWWSGSESATGRYAGYEKAASGSLGRTGLKYGG